MTEGPERLKQGLIVWVEVEDPRGHRKKRPVVILTKTEEIILDARISGVPITTSFPDPPPEGFIKLPWFREGHAMTHLCRPSAAVCHWPVSFKPSDIVRVMGEVPKLKLIEINKTIRSANT